MQRIPSPLLARDREQAGDATTTDSRSQRNRASRRGGQLAINELAAQNATPACPTCISQRPIPGPADATTNPGQDNPQFHAGSVQLHPVSSFGELGASTPPSLQGGPDEQPPQELQIVQQRQLRRPRARRRLEAHTVAQQQLAEPMPRSHQIAAHLLARTPGSSAIHRRNARNSSRTLTAVAISGSGVRRRPRRAARLASHARAEAVAVGVATVGLGAVVFAPYVRSGGFNYDDWSESATMRFAGFGGLAHDIFTMTPRRP